MSHNIRPRARVSQSRVWVYFKQSDGDPDKARCNLCSTEICHRGKSNPLWSHVKVKHSIDRDRLSLDDDQSSLLDSACMKLNPKSVNTSKQSGSKSSNSKSHITTANNHHQHLNNNSNSNSHSDLILDFNELSLAASMKPLPSTSLSKNLISRLNQLSSPVARKLKFWNKKSFQVNQYDPSFKVIYLGNLGVQLWSKDESCLDKPLSTLWNNYLVNMKTEIVMRLTICNSGLKAITRQHGLTQYWSNRLVYCCSHKNYPRIFSWVYRHEGKKMRQELRCHAVFCPSPEKASKMVTLLNERISCALQEFRREKKSRSSSSSTMIVTSNHHNHQSTNYESPFHQNCLQRTVPLRRQILAKGSANFRPPLERSKSAPKLTSIMEEEDYESSSDEDVDDGVVGQLEDALHDVFEYEESFGDKDDDSEDDSDRVDDEDDDTKNESNSLTTTVNEETSNSSAYATGDRSYDATTAHHHDNQSSTTNHVAQTKELTNMGESWPLANDHSDNHQNNQHLSDCHQHNDFQNNQTVDHHQQSHRNQIQIKSANTNTNTSSSSDNKPSVALLSNK